MTRPILQFQDLSERHPGVSSGVAASYSEAARVCLDRHHTPPIVFTVNRLTLIEATAEWIPTDARSKSAWANTTDATEAGACCLGLAAVEISDGLVAVARAETHTGADYYLAPAGSDLDDLEQTHRLEVSGVDGGGASTLKARLRQKIEQAAAGRSNLPALAAVIGFRYRQILLADVVQE